MTDELVHVAVVGDRVPGFEPQDAIATALAHSGAAAGADVEVTWVPTPALLQGTECLHEVDALWCAPGGPFVSFEGALEGVRFARENRRPFLGTCAGFQHGVIEFARNVLDEVDTHHPEYGPSTSGASLFVEELLCSLVGQSMAVRLVDETTWMIYGTVEAVERYYCRFGLRESRVPALASAGLVVAGIDQHDGGTRLMRLVEHPFFFLTLFVPQTASRPERPHPLIQAYVAAAIEHAFARR